MDIIEHLRKRRAIRKYTGEHVSPELLEKILLAGRLAPSAHNSQPWKFIVVTDHKKLEKLAQVHTWAYFLKDAGAAIVVCGNPDESRHWVEDCSCAAFSMWLAAANLGLGACWVAVYPSEEREEKVRKIVPIPENYRVLCILALGVPAEEPGPRRLKPAGEVVRFT